MRRYTGLMALALVVSAGCGGCEDERNFTGEYFKPYEYGTYTIVRKPKLEAPERVSFGALGAREFASREVEIANVGRAPLKLLSVEATDKFTLRFPSFMEDAAPDVLAPGERIIAELSYVSNAGEADAGELVIRSDDPERPEHRVALTVNQSQPCLEVRPADRVDFGQVSPGRVATRTVELVNCSQEQETRIESLRVSDHVRNFTPFMEGDWDAPLAPGETRLVQVNFQPFEVREYVSQLLIGSDDPAQPERAVELIGSGAPYECPEPQIEALITDRMVSALAAPEGSLVARPLDRVVLSAAGSRGADGALITRSEWTLVSRPPDSGATLEPREPLSQELFLDLTGTYVIEAMVYDDRGVAACEPARLKIEAIPHEDVHVQLVWDTPADDDQQDGFGTDIDLHMLNMRGRWNDPRWDCFWQNLRPDWGQPGESDDPSLDIDDIDGAGPENINLSNPQLNESYQVGVHYFADQGMGRSYATVRVYLGGVLAKEMRRKPIDDQQFWRPLDILWPSRQIVEVDEVYSTIP